MQDKKGIFYLKKLEDADAVVSRKEQYYTIYSLKKEVFMTNLMDIIKEESDELSKQKEHEEQYRKKERIILEEIAKAFERERIYRER